MLNTSHGLLLDNAVKKREADNGSVDAGAKEEQRDPQLLCTSYLLVGDFAFSSPIMLIHVKAMVLCKKAHVTIS